MIIYILLAIVIWNIGFLLTTLYLKKRSRMDEGMVLVCSLWPIFLIPLLAYVLIYELPSKTVKFLRGKRGENDERTEEILHL